VPRPAVDVPREKLERLMDLAAELSPKLRRFCLAHVSAPDESLVKVAKRCGISTAHGRLVAIVKRPRVRAFIELLFEVAREAIDTTPLIRGEVVPAVMGAKETHERVSKLARSSVAELMEFDKDGVWTGDLKITQHKSDSIREINQFTTTDTKGNVTTRTQVRLEDRLRALELAGKINGAFTGEGDALSSQKLRRFWDFYCQKYPKQALELHRVMLEHADMPALLPAPEGS
jgi:hypothetical protein